MNPPFMGVYFYPAVPYRSYQSYACCFGLADSGCRGHGYGNKYRHPKGPYFVHDFRGYPAGTHYDHVLAVQVVQECISAKHIYRIMASYVFPDDDQFLWAGESRTVRSTGLIVKPALF